MKKRRVLVWVSQNLMLCRVSSDALSLFVAIHSGIDASNSMRHNPGMLSLLDARAIERFPKGAMHLLDLLASHIALPPDPRPFVCFRAMSSCAMPDQV